MPRDVPGRSVTYQRRENKECQECDQSDFDQGRLSMIWVGLYAMFNSYDKQSFK
jgi:hypothetical protein